MAMTKGSAPLQPENENDFDIAVGQVRPSDREPVQLVRRRYLGRDILSAFDLGRQGQFDDLPPRPGG